MSRPAAGSRRIPDPGFAGDEGGGDPQLRTALAAYAVDPARQVDVLLALTSARSSGRLLVPVVAVLGESEVGDQGLAREKTSDMATALLTGRDGRQALLAFTGLDALAAWREDARPVPVTVAVAARSAIQEGAAALLLDVAGPTTYAVEGEVLEALARGWTLVRTPEGAAWVEAVDRGRGIGG
jgi:hypothetical protein